MLQYRQKYRQNVWIGELCLGRRTDSRGNTKCEVGGVSEVGSEVCFKMQIYLPRVILQCISQALLMCTWQLFMVMNVVNGHTNSYSKVSTKEHDEQTQTRRYVGSFQAAAQVICKKTTAERLNPA